MRDADVLLVIGERLGEMTTSGYTLLEAARADAGADPRASRAPRNSAACTSRRSPSPRRPAQFLAAMRCASSARRAHGATSAARAHADYVAWRAPRAVPGAVDMWQIVRWLDERAARRCDPHQRRGQLRDVAASPLSLSAAFARSSRRTPARWATACRRRLRRRLVHPQRIVVSWNGDGCFLMNGQELATAVQYGLRVIFVVVDNGMYGTIRMHQERNYPGRVSGTDLVNPDFAALARAYGAHGETVVATDEFAPAFERALASGRPVAAARADRSPGADDERDARRLARARDRARAARERLRKARTAASADDRRTLRSPITRQSSSQWPP